MSEIKYFIGSILSCCHRPKTLELECCNEVNTLGAMFTFVNFSSHLSYYFSIFQVSMKFGRRELPKLIHL